MTSALLAYAEAAAQHEPESTPLSHVSIELGHFYAEDANGGDEPLRRHFSRVTPWARAATEDCALRMSPRRARVSTCFMVDDYNSDFDSPAKLIPQLLRAAAESGLTIDYLAREGACAETDGVPLASLVERQLVPVPVPGTTGVRPATAETGWLCNGQRSPYSDATQAMNPDRRWRKPYEHGAGTHSVFVDVELWDEQSGARRWSRPFLAAVWQLNRLGLLRHRNRVVAAPQPAPEEYPATWADMPAVIRLNPDAAPFYAYRTVSVLGSRFLAVEHAVRTILNQVSVDDVVSQRIRSRGKAEGITLTTDLVERIDYVFLTD